MKITRAIHDKMASERLLFVYRGDITDRNSLPLITLLENEMIDDSYGFIGQKRLFMFVLESLQNIAKHGHHDKYGKMSMVTYSKTDDGYSITTGNVIANDHINDLKNRLNDVKRLDRQEIKSLYRQVLNTSEFSRKGGAGLGLIEMAVKTGNRLDFDFAPLNDGHSYFILNKTVDADGISVDPAHLKQKFESNSVVQLEHMMAENKIYMVWSGHISSGVGEEVLSLTETKLHEDDVESSLRKRVFNIMVEILENVSKYNPGRESEQKHGMPIVLVSLEEGNFVLTTGNLLYNSNVDELSRKIDQINSFGKKELKDLYFTSLLGQSIDTDSTGNMGLISVARRSDSKLDYHFQKVNDQYSYFMMTVKVGCQE